MLSTQVFQIRRQTDVPPTVTKHVALRICSMHKKPAFCSSVKNAVSSHYGHYGLIHSPRDTFYSGFQALTNLPQCISNCNQVVPAEVSSGLDYTKTQFQATLELQKATTSVA